MRQSLIRTTIVPVLLAVEFAVPKLSWPVYSLLMAVVTAVWVLYLRWATKKATARMANLRVGTIGLHTLRIGIDGIRQQDTVLDTSVRWEKIIEIAQSPHPRSFSSRDAE